MKAIVKFALQFGAKFSLTGDLTMNKAGRYFLRNKALLKVARNDFYYSGMYLGKIKKGKFFPSFNLLMMLAQRKANKIVVDKKAAWLFICGRDIFQKAIVDMHGSRRKGDHTLVLNEFGDCLGFGRIVRSLNGSMKNEVAVKNVLDVGDFLRREI